MADAQDTRRLGVGEISNDLLALPLGTRFATSVGNVYLATASLGLLAFECAVTWLPGHTSPVGFLTGTFDREHSSLAGYLLLMLSIVVAYALHEGPGYRRGPWVLLGPFVAASRGIAPRRQGRRPAGGFNPSFAPEQ